VKAFQDREIVRPLRPQLGFEFLVGKDTFSVSRAYGGISHRQCADHEFVKRHGFFLCFVGHQFSQSL
jgi:hypothetical protein